jgi:hypothetical protein
MHMPPASLTKTKTISIPGGIHDMYLTPDGKYVVAGANRNEVPLCKCGVSAPTNLGYVAARSASENDNDADPVSGKRAHLTVRLFASPSDSII